MIEGGRLAGGADGDKSVYAAFDLEFDELLQVSVVDLLIAERCDEGRDRTGDRAEFHGYLLIVTLMRKAGAYTECATFFCLKISP